MAETIIGKVMMTFRGEYDANTSYTYLDEVTYNGSTYLCRADATGVLPNDNDHWAMLAKAGRDGRDGINGKDGAPGKDGKDGAPGKDGKDGDQGPQGVPGQQGEPGVPGTNGKDGIDGKDGQPGRDGTDGKSAYQIWLDNGHIGTEADFLNSLKGAKGDPGQNGTNGQDGKDAIDTVKTITSGTLSSLSTGKYEIECWPSDTPIQEWGLCDVVVGQHYAKQVFTVTGATGDDQGNVYVRVRDYSGQWHEWRKITAWN